MCPTIHVAMCPPDHVTMSIRIALSHGTTTRDLKLLFGRWDLLRMAPDMRPQAFFPVTSHEPGIREG